MTVYHGTAVAFTSVDLAKSHDRRDFGRGFYTTTIFDQAAAWAGNVFTRYGGVQHGYDVVVGPVANDNTMRTIMFYISGVYTTEMALDQLKFFKANNQVSFHTERALSCLKSVRTEVLNG